MSSTEHAPESAARYDKVEVLQVLLDTQTLAGDIFDAVDTDSLVLTPQLLAKVANLTRRLAALHEGFVAEYVFSGRAADDMLAGVQESLRRDRSRRG